METHSLQTAFNLRKIFSYDDSSSNHKIEIFKEIKPLKSIGEYAVIYLKTDSQALLSTLFGDAFSKYKDNFQKVDFTSKKKIDDKGLFYKVLGTTYQYLNDMSLLNQYEKVVYLKFIDGDKVFVILSSNQKATSHIAQSMVIFLENVLQG